MDDVTKFYVCDPNKNTKCSKDACFINGGECDCTTHSCYAKTDSDGKPIRYLDILGGISNENN